MSKMIFHFNESGAKECFLSSYIHVSGSDIGHLYLTLHSVCTFSSIRIDERFD